MSHRTAEKPGRVFADMQRQREPLVIVPAAVRPSVTPAWQLRAERLSNSSHADSMAHAKRVGDADPASTLHYECGLLHAHIGMLCGELDAFRPTRNPDLHYAEVTLDALGCEVWAALDDEGTLTECWLHGTNIAALLTDGAADQLVQAMGEAAFLASDQARIDRYADRMEDFA